MKLGALPPFVFYNALLAILTLSSLVAVRTWQCTCCTLSSDLANDGVISGLIKKVYTDNSSTYIAIVTKCTSHILKVLCCSSMDCRTIRIAICATIVIPESMQTLLQHPGCEQLLKLSCQNVPMIIWDQQ